MIQILGGIGEWVIGNTFSCALFFTYGTYRRFPVMRMPTINIIKARSGQYKGQVSCPYLQQGFTTHRPATHQRECKLHLITLPLVCTIAQLSQRLQYRSLTSYTLRVLLHCLDDSHICIHNMFHPNQHLPFYRSFPPRYHLCFIRSHLLPVSAGGSCSCCSTSDGVFIPPSPIYNAIFYLIYCIRRRRVHSVSLWSCQSGISSQRKCWRQWTFRLRYQWAI